MILGKFIYNNLSAESWLVDKLILTACQTFSVILYLMVKRFRKIYYIVCLYLHLLCGNVFCALLNIWYIYIYIYIYIGIYRSYFLKEKS